MIAVIEFSKIAVADGLTKFYEAARLLGNLDGKQRLALLTYSCPVSDVAQPIEVHIGTTVNRDQRLLAHTLLCQFANFIKNFTTVFIGDLDAKMKFTFDM